MKWFLLLLLLLLVALLLQWGPLVYMLYVLIAMLVFCHLLVFSTLDQVTARRVCQRYSVSTGQTITVTLEIKHHGRVPIIWSLWEDVVPGAEVKPEPPLRVQGARIKPAMIRAGGRLLLVYRLKFLQRGYYQVGPLLMETGDLFGLFRRFRVVSEPQFVMVYPEVMPMEGWDIASRRPIGEVRMGLRIFEDPTRVAGVRQYERGDPMKHIHWKTSARMGALHTRLHEPSTVAGATMLLDYGTDAFPPKTEPYRSELAVVAAASIAHTLYHMGQVFGLVTNGIDKAERIRREGWKSDFRSREAAREALRETGRARRWHPQVMEADRGPEQFANLLDVFARLELSEHLNLQQTILETSSRFARDATVLAILCRVTPEKAMALGNLKRRGLVVSAIVNTYDEEHFAHDAALLEAEGIKARHLRDRDSIVTLCRERLLQHIG
jgi:uncharacterized protein (DUF58 family)